MKAITIHVSEPVYQEFKEHAKRSDRKTAELIREAMEQYRKTHFTPQPSVLDWSNYNAGKMLMPFSEEDDLLDEMSNA